MRLPNKPMTEAKLAGMLLGPVAATVVRALEALGRDRGRQVAGGFPSCVASIAAVSEPEAAFYLAELERCGLVERRGVRVCVLCRVSAKEAQRRAGPLWARVSAQLGTLPRG